MRFDPSARGIAAADPQLERGLRIAILAGLALSLLLPWRSEWIGFTPLWLLGMPLSAWWALHRFRLPLHRPAAVAPRRRRGPQAQRRRSARSAFAASPVRAA